MQTCENCTHYLRHYILNSGKLCRIYCGHCTYAKPKTKKPDAPSCQYYAPKSPDEEIYVTREYLTKELLGHFLSLELLPEIPDAPISANLGKTYEFDSKEKITQPPHE